MVSTLYFILCAMLHKFAWLLYGTKGDCFTTQNKKKVLFTILKACICVDVTSFVREIQFMGNKKLNILNCNIDPRK